MLHSALGTSRAVVQLCSCAVVHVFSDALTMAPIGPLLRLAPDPGICSLPSFDWPLTREYARSPPFIGLVCRLQEYMDAALDMEDREDANMEDVGMGHEHQGLLFQLKDAFQVTCTYLPRVLHRVC
eukprot:1185605-Prorocentrum_minimum.AAC.2